MPSVLFVVPSRIELESRASETLILSVVLQDRILFQQAMEVAAEYFYRDGEQNYAKKLTNSNHTCRSQHFFQPVQGTEDDIYDNQVDQDGQ